MGGDSCTVLAAGLPNITGAIWSIAGTGGNGIGNGRAGAFYGSHTATSDVTTGQTGSSSANDTINFDASRSNEIYGKSDKVLPESFALIPQIKY